MKGWKTAQPQDQVIRGKWWETFNDPQLNGLEERVDVSNQNLKVAEAQFRQARALVRFYRAGYYPTLTVGPSITGEQSFQEFSYPRLPWRAGVMAITFCPSICLTRRMYGGESAVRWKRPGQARRPARVILKRLS